MLSMKKILSAALCASMLVCPAVYANSGGGGGAGGKLIETQEADVTIKADKTEIETGSGGFKITVTIDNLQDSLKSADITLKADTEGIFTFDGNVKITNETPSKDTVTKDVDVSVQADKLADAPKDVKFTIESAVLKNESDAQMECTLGEAVTVKVINPVVYTATLTFDTALAGTDGISVKFINSEDENDVTNAVMALRADDKKIVDVAAESGLAEGTYNVAVTADGYKIPEIAPVVIDAENTEPVFSAELKVKGYNDDAVIDIFDFHKICSAVKGEITDVMYDLNRDGKVDKKDAAVIVSAWTASLAK